MRKNIWKDGMMGLVTGDALGNPVQFLPREEVKKNPVIGMRAGGAFDTPAGTWTDDSSMALATLSAIRDGKGLHLDEIMYRFIGWLYDGEYTPFGKAFDEGATCTSAIQRFMRSDHDWSTCGQTGEYANGNGALMRILPICLFHLDEDDSFAITHVHQATLLTHNHARAKIASGLYYFMAKAIVKEGGTLNERLQKGMDRCVEFYKAYTDTEYAKEIERYGRMFCVEDFRHTSESGIKSSGYVVDTLEAAVWSLANTGTFQDALLKAVNLGDDADTVGAVAGGLAGLYYGYDGIREEWLSKLQRREWIERMCEDMIK